MAPRKKKWSAWTGWMWSDEYQQEFRYRNVENTETFEYQYREAPQAPAQAPAQAPTQAGNYTYSNPVQGITNQLAQTTLGSAGGSSQIISAQSSNAPLDRNFKIHSSSSFQEGKVLKIVWTEPRGNGGTVITNYSTGKHNEPLYSTIRRFVIVKPNRGHSLCVPILTYSQQGLLKPGVKAEHHCVVYTGKKAETLDGEYIHNRSLKMVSYSAREKLDKTSRMNYAKVYTVEHNVKVYFIGEIYSKDWNILVEDYNRINKLDGDMPRTSESYGVSYSSGQVSYSPSYGHATTQSYGITSPYVPGTSPSFDSGAASSYVPRQAYQPHPETETEGQSHKYDRTLYDDDG